MRHTFSIAFKGKNEDLRVIGEALGVKTVLEGSVRKSGDRVRIAAHLVDVSDGTHIWSDSYDRTITDIFAIQDDVAAAIIDALQMHVTTMPIRRQPTENMEAYALFLKARPALALDPDLAFADALFANASDTATLLRTLEAFERASLESPNNPGILSWVSWFKQESGTSRRGWM